ncbi:MAG: hypothetical protein O9294_16230 [Cytophagales bacterium]|jgi:hypothetical protein|nr:hypothetical protein [Cytophagales bacterium]
MHVFFRNIGLALVILLPSVVNAQSFNPTLASLLQQKLDSIRVAYQIKGVSACVCKTPQANAKPKFCKRATMPTHQASSPRTDNTTTEKKGSH